MDDVQGKPNSKKLGTDSVLQVPELAGARFPMETPGLNEEFNQYLDYYLETLRGDQKKILIVEDDLFSFKVLQAMIHEFDKDIQCFWATSKDEAVKVLQDVGFGLVISDFFLNQEETGLDLCEHIKKNYPNTECAMISSLMSFQFQELLKDSSVTPHFFEKPVSKENMKSYLAEFFGGRYVA